MYSTDKPWIKEREATLCTWKLDYNRGYVGNTSVSLLSDFMCLSDRQLVDYAKMIKACGFTGIQAMDICAAWRASGSPETVHDRFKKLADACHANGLNFTLWCWAAEFSGHGWTEPSAVYRNRTSGRPAFEDPEVAALFEKYYDIYAELAPYCDRVIAHFFDPGNLTDTESIIYFLKRFAEKFRAVNPSVKIGVDTWGCPDDFPEILVKSELKDVMLMELPFLPSWQEEGKRARFRRGVKNTGCSLGVWGWYTADMEIDQLAMMAVNGRVLKDVLNTVRAQGDSVMIPEYWSETDSYHILNYFSLYAAGHLLTDPEADADKLLFDSALALTGDREHAEALKYVLEVIRDARSGDSWDTYWWTSPKYVLRNLDFEDILPRVENAITKLEALIKLPEPSNGIPFPIRRQQLYRLMLPHLQQIRQYGEFCRDIANIEKMKSSGAGTDALQKLVDRLDCEIPEYNCVTGLWGQPEAREAFLRCGQFCRENGLKAPERSPFVKFKFKRRIVDRLTVAQRGLKDRLSVDPLFYEGGLAGPEFTEKLMEELFKEGVLAKDENGRYYLSGWRELAYDFSY
ncbi:MAG: hypothetical protein J6112_10695 [Clostridia bacterium]|nr:hypothetical protein [Clostridia bacterium]